MARNRRPRMYDQEHEAREGEPVAVQVVATDRNPGDTLTYSIVSGNGSGLFEIDPLTGIISRTDGGVFDYETDARRYDLRVRVTDDGNPPKSRTADVTIRITDAPDAPHEITVANLSVDENAAGAVIGAVAVADQDDDHHVLTVDDARFEIVNGVLKLKAGESLDHESDDPVTVTITASDDDDGSLSQSFTVTVNDLNEAPTGLSLSTAAVDENAAGAVVGLITVADPDDPLEPFGMHEFSVDDARFEVIGTVLKLKDGETLDHETADQVTVTVTATGVGGASVSQALGIAVNDVNEAPTAISLSNASVNEFEGGAIVGALTVVDPDDPAEPFGTHTLTVNNSSFEIVDGNLKLLDWRSLNHEIAETIVLTVTATDGAGARFSQAFEIAVNDVNETPTFWTGTRHVLEGAPVGTVVGNIQGFDYDDPASPFGTLTYSLTDDAGGRFTVDSATGEITTTAILDHEDQSFHFVTAKVTDGGGLFREAQFSVWVTDVNEAPTLTVTPIIAPEEMPGAAVAQVVASDPEPVYEPFGTLAVTVDDSRFEVVSGQLRLKDGIALDFETEPEITLTVTATDGGGLSASQTVTIPVTDTAEGGTAISLASLDGSNGVALVGTDPGGLLGYAVSAAGDMNGDGFDDVIVTAPYQSGTGAGYVVFGSAAGWPAAIDVTQLDGTNGFRLEDASLVGGIGVSADGIGDLNGDGIDDLIVSATPSATSYSYPVPPGSGYVVFGKTEGWTPVVDVSALDGSDGVRLQSGPESVFLGWTVAGAGDVNGDGIDDVALSNPSPYSYGDTVASGYVVFGKASGWSSSFDVEAMDGTDGFAIRGLAPSDHAVSVGDGGDFNGDGLDDVLVSFAYLAATAGYGPPPADDTAYIAFGRSDWSASVDVTMFQGDGVVITGLTGPFDSSDLGSAGDVNGDGIEDIIIGSRGSESNGYNSGSVFVIFGRPAGWPDTLDVSALDGTDGFRIDGSLGDDIGHVVGSAGDVNGDGYDDMLIGGLSSPYDGVPGSIYVLYGQAGGFDPVFDIGAIDGFNGFRIDAVAAKDQVGSAADAAGDVNGDGFDDIVIGGRNAGEGGYYPNYPPGEGYIVFGGDFTSTVTSLGTDAADTLAGTAGTETLLGAQGDDILLGHGGADVLNGGAGDDILAVGDLDFSRIDGGSGTDTLRLDGAGQSLDLTAIGDTVIDGIERLDLTGSGANSLTLAVTDLLKISGESNDLFVAGNAGDHVTLVGNWQNDGAITVDGVSYNTFSAAGVSAALYVEDDITFTTGV